MIKLAKRIFWLAAEVVMVDKDFIDIRISFLLDDGKLKTSLKIEFNSTTQWILNVRGFLFTQQKE